MSSDQDDESAGGADDEGSPDAPRWAADEPTAMWDDSILKDAGYDQLASHREEKPREATGPATKREVGGDLGQGIHVSREAGAAPAAAPAAPRSSALGWILTGVLAILLGGGVYVLIRFLR